MIHYTMYSLSTVSNDLRVFWCRCAKLIPSLSLFCTPAYVLYCCFMVLFCLIAILHSEGAFGALRVTYRTRQLDLGGVAAVLGAASISYFTVTAGQGVLGSSDPVIPSTNLTHCSDRCLLSATCIVFTFSTSSDCRLYSSVGTTRSDVTLTLYTKSGTTVSALLSACFFFAPLKCSLIFQPVRLNQSIEYGSWYLVW